MASAVKKRSALGPWAPRVLIAAVVLSALLSIGFVLFGVSGETLGRVLSTNVTLVVFALLVWADSVLGRYRPDWFEFSSLAADAYLLLVWIGVIWLGPFGTFSGSDTFANFFVSLGVLLWVRAMLGLGDLLRLLWNRMRSSVTDVIAVVGLIAIALVAVLVTLPAPYPLHDLWDLDFYGRVIGALSIVAGGCFVLVPLWALLGSRGEKAHAFGAPGAYGQPVAYPQSVPPASAPVAPAPAPAPAAAPAPAPAPAPAAAPSIPPMALAWPLLADGRPVPAGQDGHPDFSRLAPTDHLAWPTFADGSPVPAGPDGAPLYR
ncbi:hypothetical protein ACFVWR_08310 [Leifsonia sp. NPDC058292]|uniref:hypothetical protein n=1 Tax=Leifsonia sp. NPDC058292 TaxID=3346428 RepID=UPI0036DA391D